MQQGYAQAQQRPQLTQQQILMLLALQKQKEQQRAQTEAQGKKQSSSIKDLKEGYDMYRDARDLLGYGSSTSPVANATAATNAAYGGNAALSGVSSATPLSQAAYGGNAFVPAGELGGTAVQSTMGGGATYAPSTASTASSGTPMFDVGAPSYAGYAAAALQAYNTVKNWDKVADEDKATKAQQQAALAVANVYTGGLASAAEGFARKQWGGTMSKIDKLDKKTNPITILSNKFGVFGSKKADQQARDSLRKDLIKNGVISNDWQMKYSDGSQFDVGKDGGARLQSSDGKGRQYREIDFNDPRAGKATGNLQFLSSLMGTKGGDKVDMTGYFVNGALQGNADDATTRQRIKDTYSKFGINSRDDYYKAVNDRQSQGSFDEQMGHVYRNAANDIWGADAPSSTTPLFVEKKRTTTLSPGIGKDGKRIDYSRRK